MLLNIIGTFLCTYITVSGEEEVCPKPKPICAFKLGVGTRNYPNECTARKDGAWPFGPAPCPKKRKNWNPLPPEASKRGIVDSQELLSSRRYFDKQQSVVDLKDLFNPRPRQPTITLPFKPCDRWCQEIKKATEGLGSLTSTPGENGGEVPLRVLTDPNRSKIVLTPPLALLEQQANLPLEKQRSFSLTGRTLFSRKPCNCPKDRWYTYGCDGRRYLNSCEAKCRSKGVRKNGKCILAYQ